MLSLTPELALLVGALIGAAAPLISQHLERSTHAAEAAREREARKKELLLKAALDIATLRTNHALELAKGGQHLTLIDPLNMAEVYYRQLAHLYDRGELPEDAYWDMTPEEKAALKGTAPLKSTRTAAKE